MSKVENISGYLGQLPPQMNKLDSQFTMLNVTLQQIKAENMGSLNYIMDTRIPTITKYIHAESRNFLSRVLNN